MRSGHDRPESAVTLTGIRKIKFDGDKWGEFQEEDYEKISGRGKLAELTPGDCSCDDPDRKKRSQLLKNTQIKDELLQALDALGGGGRRGVRRSMPKKLPNLKD